MPRRILFAANLLFALLPPLHAQQAIITLDSAATTPQLQAWLHSGDPRLIAWSATLTARMHDKTILAEMPSLLEHWTIPSNISYSLDEPQREQRRAAEAVLDTLIQENAPVPVSTIRSIAEFFPAQALVLVARLPLKDTASLLHDWTYQATGAWAGRTLARVASMMLAKEPTANFIDEVLRASEEELSIAVAASSEKRWGVGSGACGDSIGREVAPGWPKVFTYDLQENNSQSASPLVVKLDEDKIASRRFPENTPLGSCSGVSWLDPTTRHRLIAHWLGVKPRDMAWQPVVNKSIVWTTQSAYEHQLGSLVETERQKLRATVDTLIQRSLIQQGTAPQLRVTISCDIKPCPLASPPTPSNYLEIPSRSSGLTSPFAPPSRS